jgi:hypothetical protein
MEAIFGEAELWLDARFARLTPEETESFLLGLEVLHKTFSNSLP